MMAFNVGAVVGYTLGGAIITFLGWRSIFLINVPVGVFGTIWAYKRLKEVSVRAPGQRFDYLGSALYSAGLSVILLALTIGDPASLPNILILVAGIAIFAVVVLVERRQRFPTLDLRLFKIRVFAAGNLASFLNSVAFSCGPFLRSIDFRKHQPPMLIVWGKNDQIFPAAGAEPYNSPTSRRSSSTCSTPATSRGSKATGNLIARLMRDFLGRHIAAK